MAHACPCPGSGRDQAVLSGHGHPQAPSPGHRVPQPPWDLWDPLRGQSGTCICRVGGRLRGWPGRPRHAMLSPALRWQPRSRRAQAPSQLSQAGRGQWRAPSTQRPALGRREGEGPSDASARGAGTGGGEAIPVAGRGCPRHEAPVLLELGISSRGRGLGDAPCPVPRWHPTARHQP